jgi:hypothetical protein
MTAHKSRCVLVLLTSRLCLCLCLCVMFVVLPACIQVAWSQEKVWPPSLGAHASRHHTGAGACQD